MDIDYERSEEKGKGRGTTRGNDTTFDDDDFLDK
jgi:hypothetical protein